MSVLNVSTTGSLFARNARRCASLDPVPPLGKDANNAHRLPRSARTNESDIGRMKSKSWKKASREKPARRPQLSGLHQSIARPTAVLEALASASSEGLRMTDVMRLTGLGKATVHRLLAGLAAAGLVDQDSATSRFFVGMRILAWAVSAGERFGLARLAEPAMVRLAQSTSDTIYLTVRSGDEALCLNRREGTHPIKTLTLNVGERRPLGVSAGGLALLAFLPDQEAERILMSQANTRTPFPFDQFTLRKMMLDSRKAGFAFYDAPVLHGSEVVTGMAAVAVPIHGPDKRPIAALSVAAIASRLQVPRRKAIVVQLQNEARLIASSFEPVPDGAHLDHLTRA
jgi:DNA-binding IclR family transcriptional regulator